jgi:ABC-type iron transport system FetAB permease component
MQTYWLKVGLGLLIVSIPFLYAAIQKKISWQFFWSWTFTSVFATLSFLFVQNRIEANVNPQTKLIISMIMGAAFVGVGIYLRSIKSKIPKRVSWLFIVFGIAWALLSIPN